ncbi:hypothetical protein DFH06DRAFT_1143514 [Mycena polygramma]|nr:hypothetical protein DFH06DRAFT_1143514 [Mycena polygramma]
MLDAPSPPLRSTDFFGGCPLGRTTVIRKQLSSSAVRRTEVSAIKPKVRLLLKRPPGTFQSRGNRFSRVEMEREGTHDPSSTFVQQYASTWSPHDAELPFAPVHYRRLFGAGEKRLPELDYGGFVVTFGGRLQRGQFLAILAEARGRATDACRGSTQLGRSQAADLGIPMLHLVPLPRGASQAARRQIPAPAFDGASNTWLCGSLAVRAGVRWRSAGNSLDKAGRAGAAAFALARGGIIFVNVVPWVTRRERWPHVVHAVEGIGGWQCGIYLVGRVLLGTGRVFLLAVLLVLVLSSHGTRERWGNVETLAVKRHDERREAEGGKFYPAASLDKK